MASQELPRETGSSAEPSTPREDWWFDTKGYWRDQVLKDLVKYGVQVVAGLYAAVVIGLITPDDERAKILLWVVVVIYVFTLVVLGVRYGNGHTEGGELFMLVITLGAFNLVQFRLNSMISESFGRVSSSSLLYIVLLLPVVAGATAWRRRRGRARK